MPGRRSIKYPSWKPAFAIVVMCWAWEPKSSHFGKKAAGVNLLTPA